MKTRNLCLNGEFVFTEKNIAVNNPATGQAESNSSGGHENENEPHI